MRGTGRGGSGRGAGMGAGRGMGAGGGWSGGGMRAGGGRGGRGMGPGQGALPAQAAAGYSYVGSCRCGFGPNAYYQDTQGQIVPSRTLFTGVEQTPGEIERLRAEKAELERRLGDLEERLRDSK